jgi:hypothetical protein
MVIVIASPVQGETADEVVVIVADELAGGVNVKEVEVPAEVALVEELADATPGTVAEVTTVEALEPDGVVVRVDELGLPALIAADCRGGDDCESSDTRPIAETMIATMTTVAMAVGLVVALRGAMRGSGSKGACLH